MNVMNRIHLMSTAVWAAGRISSITLLASWFPARALSSPT